MAVTVLSGTSGALYYKPAGTIGTFNESSVDTAQNQITIGPFLGFRVGDPVAFDFIDKQSGLPGSGTLPSGLTENTTFYVIAYNSTTGVLQVSATPGGSAVNLSDDGTLVNPNVFQISYADFAAIGQVQSWNLEIERAEIDVTTIGQTPKKQIQFRQYIGGLGDATGTAVVWVVDDDAPLSNRLIEDVVLNQQIGCTFKLYTDKQASEALSRSISFQAVLTSASRSVNPNDGQNVEITFRPSSSPDFDFSTSA